MRRRLHLIAAAVIVLGLVFAMPSAATAATVSASVSSEVPPDGYIPSKSKWRAYMINVMGSVLGSATPKPWQREQLANRYAQGGLPSGEQLNQMYGYTRLERDPVTGTLRPEAPSGSGTYDDIVIGERDKIRNGTTTRPGQKIPATAANALMKGATVLSAFSFGTMLGSAGTNLAGSFFGFDANGTVCAQTSNLGFGGDMLNLISGQDCSGWMLNEAYIPNFDATGQSSLTYAGVTWVYRGVNAQFADNLGHDYCFNATSATLPPGVASIQYKNNSGGWISMTTFAAGSRCNNVGGSNRVTTLVPNTVAGGRADVILRFALTGGGYVDRVTASNDPTRHQTCKVTFTDGTSASADGPGYTESSGDFAPAQCPPTPPGKVVDNITLTENGNGPAKELYSEDTTDAFKEWAAQDECATGACLLDLLVKTPSGIYVSCFDLEEGCAGWFEDPAKGDTYTCRYGTQEKDLAECNVYSGLFTPGRLAVGAPYSDPLTGSWSGGQSSGRPDRDAMGQTVQNPAATYRSCDGMNVTGFDPIGFVMRPIQCALEWAAIPRPLVAEASFAGVADVWAGKPPGAIAEAVDEMTLTGGATGCAIATTYKGTTAPLVDACGGFMQGLATFSRLATTAMMIVLVFGQVRRQIAGMVNYNVGQD